MNIKHTLLIGMALSFSACTQNENNDIIPGTVDATNLDEAEMIKIENFEGEVCGKYSDIYSDVRYVPLECSENSMVGNIDKVLSTKNNDLLIFDFSAKAVFLFDSEGKFKNRIGEAGHAEKEYVEPLDIVYDEYHNNVIVYDNAKKVLAYYDMDGTYLHKIQLKDYISSFEVLDKDHLVLYYNYRGVFLKEDDINYNYKIIDTEGKVVKEFAPYDKTTGDLIMNSDVFYKNNGELYCHISNTPVVNKITLDSMTPVYNIDFGDFQIPSKWYMNGYKVYDKKVSNLSSKGARLVGFYQSGSTILMRFSFSIDSNHGGTRFVVKHNEKSDKLQIYSRLINDMYGKQVTYDLKNVVNGSAYFVLDPSFIDPLSRWPVNVDISKMMADEQRNMENKYPPAVYSQLKPSVESVIKLVESESTSIVITKEEKEFVEKLSKTSNPIIQICKIK